MAKVTIEGIADVVQLMDNLADIPDEIINEMLVAGGEVAEEALKYSTLAKGVVDTGQVYDSITLGKPRKDRSIAVTFAGTRKGSKSRNAEIAYINEYGAPSKKIKPRQFIRAAYEDASDPAVAAAAEIFDSYLETLK